MLPLPLLAIAAHSEKLPPHHTQSCNSKIHSQHSTATVKHPSFHASTPSPKTKIAQQGPGLIQHKNVEGRNTQGLEVEQPCGLEHDLSWVIGKHKGSLGEPM
jgi:hypothetical protein